MVTNDDIVVRLTPGPYRASSNDRRWIVSGGIGGAVLLVGAIVRIITGGQSAVTLVIAIVIAALVIVALFGYARLRLRNAAIYIKGDRLGMINAFGMRTEIPMRMVDHLERVSGVPTSGREVTNMLLIVAKDRRKSFAFAGGDRLESQGLAQMAERLGVPINGNWSN